MNQYDILKALPSYLHDNQTFLIFIPHYLLRFDPSDSIMLASRTTVPCYSHAFITGLFACSLVDGFPNLHPTVLRAVYPDSGLLVTPLRIITFRRHTAKIPRLGGMPEA